MTTPEANGSLQDVAAQKARAWREQLDGLKELKDLWAILPEYKFSLTTPPYPDRQDAWRDFESSLDPGSGRRISPKRRETLQTRRVFLAFLDFISQKDIQTITIGDISFKITFSPLDPMVFKLGSIFLLPSGRLFISENVGVSRAAQLSQTLLKNSQGVKNLILRTSLKSR